MLVTPFFFETLRRLPGPRLNDGTRESLLEGRLLLA